MEIIMDIIMEIHEVQAPIQEVQEDQEVIQEMVQL